MGKKNKLKNVQESIPGMPPFNTSQNGGYKIDNKMLGSSRFAKVITLFFNTLNKQVQTLNSSKLFAGLMIIILNISSKFVNFNLSKSVESYLKYTFSRQILIFAIAWMGTRDIYVAFGISLLFIFFMDYLLNEDSSMCVLPESFTTYHVNLLDNGNNVTPEEIKRAEEILEKAKKNNVILNSTKV
jgi:hypothetical protein